MKSLIAAGLHIDYEDNSENREIASLIKKLENLRLELDPIMKKLDELVGFDRGFTNLDTAKDKIGLAILELVEIINKWTKKEENLEDLSQCACDFTNHCPVHGSRKTTDHDSYLNQP